MARDARDGAPPRTRRSTRVALEDTRRARSPRAARAAVPLVVLVLVSRVAIADACSTFLVGKRASFDGSVLVTHSDDGEGNPDARLSYVPGATHAPGARRPVWPDLEDNPRFVGSGRGATYAPGRSVPPDAPRTKPIGFIDQVSTTFGYHEGNYGIINSKQLAIGESTCSGRFVANSVGNGGEALFCVNELSRVAMERCETARCAVVLMGALAYEHGFYGAAGSFEGGSETLLIGDTQEGWVMHFVPYPLNNSAVWVAKRVPDDEVTVVMNMFTIREVDLNDDANYLASPNMLDVAKKHGLWDKERDGAFDFTRAFSAGEYAHKYYSGRRVWGGFRLINKDQTAKTLSPEYGDLRLDAPYPFSMRPAQPVRVEHLFAWHRDWYQGTPYDMSKGIAAGPFGSPDRFTAAAAGADASRANRETLSSAFRGRAWGAWERSIALHRTTYTHVTQSRSWLPDAIGGVMWIGMHAAHGTCFVPTPCGVTALAEGLTLGNASLVDRRSSWWAHRYVLNVARGLRFDQAVEDIRNTQLEWERRGAGVLKEMERLFAEQSGQSETDAAPGASDEANIARITGAAARHADAARDAWWRLADALMAKFADGFVSRTQNDGSTTPGVAEGYPDWWLDAAGFADGPPPPPEPPRNGRGPGIVGGEETRAAAAASALGRRGIADA
jgi:dipeptidase